MFSQSGKTEGIEVTLTAESNSNQLTIEKILEMAKADPAILESLQNLKPGKAEAKEKTEVKSVLFGDQEEKKVEKSPELIKKLEKLTTYGGEISSEEDTPKKKRLTYRKEIVKATKSIEEEFREEKMAIKAEIPENFVPPQTADGRTYFDNLSEVESVDDDWFRDEEGFVDRQILEEHLCYMSDNEIPELPKGKDWTDETNRGNRYKYLLHLAHKENQKVFENYAKLLKYVEKLKLNFAEERLFFEEELKKQQNKFKKLEKNFAELQEKACPLVSNYEIQSYKRLSIKKSNYKAFQIQLSHVADKPGSLMYFLHNLDKLQSLKKQAKQVADVDLGAECLKFGYNETVTFYFIASRATFENAAAALIFLFRKLGKLPRLEDADAKDLIKRVALIMIGDEEMKHPVELPQIEHDQSNFALKQWIVLHSQSFKGKGDLL